MKRAIPSAAFILAVTFSLHAQSIAGTWQGTLAIPTQQGATVNRNPRLVFTIEKSPDGSFHGGITFIDYGNSVQLTSVTFSGTDVTFAQSDAGFSYHGKLGVDGRSIDGTWTQGNRFCRLLCSWPPQIPSGSAKAQRRFRPWPPTPIPPTKLLPSSPPQPTSSIPSSICAPTGSPPPARRRAKVIMRDDAESSEEVSTCGQEMSAELSSAVGVHV